MALFVWAESIRARPWAAWSLAVAAFLAGLTIRFGFDHVLPAGFPYLTFFPAVVLTAFFAGLWPGLVCGVASGLAAWYWFIPPFGGFTLNVQVVIALSFYVCIITVDLILIQVMHRTVSSLRTERAISLKLAQRQGEMLQDLQVRERRQRVLQRELSHRMKNTLAMVQAVVAQSLRHAPDAAQAASVASARIQALGRSQDMLTETNWQATDIGNVIRAGLEPHVDSPARVSIEGPPLELDAMKSMGLALTIHELATNALKYGAFSTDGTVRIEWSLSPEGEFVFSWKESGGPPVAAPTRRGFGSRLLERVMPGYFKGTSAIVHEADGVLFRLVGRLDREERAGDNMPASS